MNKVASMIQETMQKGRAIVSDRELGREAYVRLGEIYEEGFDRIGECAQTGEMPELSASWVKASSEIAKLREENPSDGKAALRRYEAFFKEAAQLAGGMIGGSVGQGIQGAASGAMPAPDSKNALLLRVKLVTVEASDGLRGKLFVPAGITPREIVDAMNQESQTRWQRHVIYPGTLNDEEMDAAQREDKVYEFFIGKDSNNKTRREQKDYLRDRGMEFTKRWVLVVAAGKHRLEWGFPDRGVGTKDEPGDLFKGKLIRVHSGAVYSNAYGVGAFEYYVDCAYVHIAAAGSPNLQKS